MDKQRFNQTGYRAGPTLRSKGRGYRGVHGHVILDHDEDNLSDKELFARNIPAIGKSKFWLRFQNFSTVARDTSMQ